MNSWLEEGLHCWKGIISNTSAVNIVLSTQHYPCIQTKLGLCACCVEKLLHMGSAFKFYLKEKFCILGNMCFLAAERLRIRTFDMRIDSGDHELISIKTGSRKKQFSLLVLVCFISTKTISYGLTGRHCMCWAISWPGPWLLGLLRQSQSSCFPMLSVFMLIQAKHTSFLFNVHETREWAFTIAYCIHLKKRN